MTRKRRLDESSQDTSQSQKKQEKSRASQVASTSNSYSNFQGNSTAFTSNSSAFDVLAARRLRDGTIIEDSQPPASPPPPPNLPDLSNLQNQPSLSFPFTNTQINLDYKAPGEERAYFSPTYFNFTPSIAGSRHPTIDNVRPSQSRSCSSLAEVSIKTEDDLPSTFPQSPSQPRSQKRRFSSSSTTESPSNFHNDEEEEKKPSTTPERSPSSPHRLVASPSSSLVIPRRRTRGRAPSRAGIEEVRSFIKREELNREEARLEEEAERIRLERMESEVASRRSRSIAPSPKPGDKISLTSKFTTAQFFNGGELDLLPSVKAENLDETQLITEEIPTYISITVRSQVPLDIFETLPKAELKFEGSEELRDADQDVGEIDMEDWTRQETVEAEEQRRLDEEMELDLEMDRGISNDSGLSPVIEDREEEDEDDDEDEESSQDSSNSDSAEDGDGDDGVDSDSDDHTILVQRRLPKKVPVVRREISIDATPDIDLDKDLDSSEEEEEYVRKKVRRSKKAVPKVKKEKVKKEKVRKERVKKVSKSKGKEKESKPDNLPPVAVGQLFGIKARLTKQLAADQESARLPIPALINALPSFNSKSKSRVDKGKQKEKIIKDEIVPTTIMSKSVSGFLDSIFHQVSTLSTFSAVNREPIVARMTNSREVLPRASSPTDSLEDYEEILNEPEVDREPDLGKILGIQPYLESPTKEGAITRWFNTISGENIVPISDEYNFTSLEEDFNLLDRYKIKRPFPLFRLPRTFQLKDGNSLIISKPGGEPPPHLHFLSKMNNQLSTLEEVSKDLMTGRNLFKPKFWSSEKRKLWNTVKREAGDKFIEQLKKVLKELFCTDSMDYNLDEMLKKIYENNWIWYEQLTVLLQIKNEAVKLSKELDISHLESLVSEKRNSILARLALAKRNRWREYEDPVDGQEAILYEGKVELELVEVNKDVKVVERIKARVLIVGL